MVQGMIGTPQVRMGGCLAPSECRGRVPLVSLAPTQVPGRSGAGPDHSAEGSAGSQRAHSSACPSSHRMTGSAKDLRGLRTCSSGKSRRGRGPYRNARPRREPLAPHSAYPAPRGCAWARRLCARRQGVPAPYAPTDLSCGKGPTLIHACDCGRGHFGVPSGGSARIGGRCSLGPNTRLRKRMSP